MAITGAFNKERARDKDVEGATPAFPTYDNPQEVTKGYLKDTTPQDTSPHDERIGNDLTPAEGKATMAMATGKSNALNNNGMGDS